MTYTRFMERFPDHDACLDYLKDRFHPERPIENERTRPQPPTASKHALLRADPPACRHNLNVQH